MPMDTNEGVVMSCKTITANLLTIVCLLVEPITPLAKPRVSLEVSLSISQNTWKVTSTNHVIYNSLYIFFYLVSILRSNIYWWITVLIYVVNSAGHCGGINTNGKMNSTSSRIYLSIIDLIKVGYVIFQVPNIRWNIIVESILRKSFQELSDRYQFVMAVSIKPIIKQFPKIVNSHSHINCCT